MNRNNFNAFILHENYGFKCTWFDNSTKVAYNSGIFKELGTVAVTVSRKSIVQKIKVAIKAILKFPAQIKNAQNRRKNVIFGENDIIVFPEIYGPYFGNVAKGVKKVIYNQGCYQTFFGYDLDITKSATPYLSSDLLATIVNSEDAFNYLHHSFPKMPLFRVHYGIDKQRFFYSEKKKKQLAFMPRRLSVDLIQVINILKFRGALEGWELKPIDGMSEDKVAELMRESAVFLSFSINEGFGMPPAEAMACGCITIGYHGKGGREYFKEDFSFPVQDRDVQQFAKTLENVLTTYDTNKSMYIEKGKTASQFILKEYAMEVEENDIVQVWNAILKLD